MFRRILATAIMLAAAVQVTVMLIALPVSLTSALASVLKFDLGFRFPIDYYRERVYPIVRELPLVHNAQGWQIDLVVSLIVLAGFSFIYWARVEHETRRQMRSYEQESAGWREQLSHLPAATDISIQPQAVNADIVDIAGAGTAVAAVVGGLPLATALGPVGWVLGLAPLIMVGLGMRSDKRNREAAEHAAHEEAEARKRQAEQIASTRQYLDGLVSERETEAKNRIAGFKRKERVKLLVAGALTAAFVIANITLGSAAEGETHGATASVHGACWTRQPTGAQCSCFDDPFKYGYSAPARSGRNLCMVQR